MAYAEGYTSGCSHARPWVGTQQETRSSRDYRDQADGLRGIPVRPLPTVCGNSGESEAGSRRIWPGIWAQAREARRPSSSREAPSQRQTVWTAGDLLERLEPRKKFFVLDVRNRDEFERFRLEGRGPLPAVNVPYFEMLELGGKDEMVDSVRSEERRV